MTNELKEERAHRYESILVERWGRGAMLTAPPPAKDLCGYWVMVSEGNDENAIWVTKRQVLWLWGILPYRHGGLLST
jgi:hypothetical protein